MGDLAAVLIDASYKEMKKACTSSMHGKWEWKLDCLVDEEDYSSLFPGNALCAW
jgi:hypothetical protein